MGLAISRQDVPEESVFEGRLVGGERPFVLRCLVTGDIAAASALWVRAWR